MYKLLSNIGLYSFQKWNGINPQPSNLTHVQCELEAYIAGLQCIENEIESIITNVFPQVADEQNIANFERLLCMPVKPQVPLLNRRKMVLDRLSIGPNDFNVNGMMRALRSVGVESDISEIPNQQKIKVTVKNVIGSFLSLDEVKSAVDAVAPAHLLLDVDTGSNSWVQMDFLGRSWTQLDALGKSWNNIEIGV